MILKTSLSPSSFYKGMTCYFFSFFRSAEIKKKCLWDYWAHFDILENRVPLKFVLGAYASLQYIYTAICRVSMKTETTTFFLMTDSICHSSLPRTVLEKVTLTTSKFRIYPRTKVDPMFYCVYISTPLKSYPYKSRATCAWSMVSRWENPP